LLITASYFYKVPALVLLFIFSFLFKLIDTVTNSRLQHQIGNPEVRATVTSVKGFFVELAVIGLYIIFGFFAKTYGYQVGFMSMGVIIVLIGLGYLLFNSKLSSKVQG